MKGFGVTMTPYNRATDEKRPYITVHWPGKDRWSSTSVSVVKHGLRGALTEAAQTLAAHTDYEMIEKALPAVARLLEDEDVHVARLNTQSEGPNRLPLKSAHRQSSSVTECPSLSGRGELRPERR